MSRNYWVISDTHFFHANSLNWPGRTQFDSVEELNETMVEKWNSVVKPGDYVYHLGDVWMGPSQPEDRAKLISRLNGSKRLVLGNHDDVFEMARGGWFKKLYGAWKIFNEFNCIMTHVPMHESSLQERQDREGWKNIHGHIHMIPSPPGPYVCVCVEQTNFTPMNLEEIRDR